MIGSGSIIRTIPKSVIKLLMPLMPTYISVLTKPQTGDMSEQGIVHSLKKT